MANMTAESLLFVALMGLLGIAAELTIEPGKSYYLMDERGGALTLHENGTGNFSLSSIPLDSSLEQQWIFRISGDKFEKLEDNLWVIRPAGRNETKTLDVNTAGDSWGTWLFDHENSRVWRLKPAGNDTAQIINSRYENCLRSEEKTNKFPVVSCGGPDPVPLTPGTVWTFTRA